MKNKIIGTIFFSTVFAFFAQAQSEKKFIQLNSQNEIETFISNSALQNKNTETVFIKAQTDSLTWENLFFKLHECGSLKSISLEDCNISAVPSVVKKFRNLNSFSLLRCDETDAEDWIEAFSTCNIRSLNLSAGGVNEIPRNVSWLGLLDTLSISRSVAPGKNFSLNIERPGRSPLVFVSNGERKDISRQEIKLLKEMVREMDVVFNENKKENQPKGNTINSYLPEAEQAITQSYSVSAVTGNTFVYERSGTVLNIPANAFVDAKGKKVNGPVNVQYKEFRGAGDIIFSGIPMHVDNADEKGDMESAGMFEIKATDEKGNPVFLAKDKSIDVNFIGTDTLKNDYNFYAFNAKDSSWSRLGNISKGGDFTTTVSSDLYSYKIPSVATGIFNSVCSQNPRIYDSTRFEDRFYSENFDYTMPKKTFAEKRRYSGRTVTRQANKQRIVKLNKFKQTKTGEVYARLNFSSAHHPELSSFSGLYFKLTDFSKVRDVKKIAGYRNKFSDIRISSNGDAFQMALKTGGKQTKLNFELFRLSGDTMIELKDGGARVVGRYQKRLKRREKTFNKVLRRKKMLDNSYYTFATDQEKKEYAYQEAQKFMIPAEKNIEKNQWIKKGYFVTQQRDRSLTASGAVTESFRVKGLGIYNCDRMYNYSQKSDIVVNLKKADGKEFKAQSVYVVLNRNSVVSYNFAGSSQMVTVPTNGKIGIVAVDSDGNVGVCKYDNWKGTTNGFTQSAEFNLTGINGEFKTADQLTGLLGF